jgi:3-oxoacyl-[acyl-carrier protein] reductase
MSDRGLSAPAAIGLRVEFVERGAGMTEDARGAIVFGARNLGKAIIETLRGAGWNVAGAARSDRTLDGVTAAGALAVRADVTEPAGVTRAIEEAVTAHGSLDLVVNAASAYGGTRSGPFGGGPIAEAAPGAFDSWAVAPPRAAFSFLSATSRFLLEQGRPATIVQVTGGSSRRAIPGRGLWAAGAFGVRALTQAAALELRERGIHVALLIVDAGIEPLSGTREGADPAALADPYEIAQAVRHLAEQGARAATHELQVTPLAERWVP